MFSSKLNGTRRNRNSRPVFGAFVILVAVAMLAGAMPTSARETIVLQMGGPPPEGSQTGAKSATLDQANPTVNTGSSADITVRSLTGGMIKRGLVMFDLSAAHDGGVKSATLSMFLRTAPTASRTYNAQRMIGFWSELGTTWNNRLAEVGSAWGTAGAGAGGTDVSGTDIATTATGTTSGVTLSWNVLLHMQNFFTGEFANAGWRISDSGEGLAAPGQTGVLASHHDPVLANRPSLTLSIVQQVRGFTATAGDASVSLSWTYPELIGTVTSATDGVVIVRKQGSPVPDSVTLTDSTLPALCSTVGDGAATSATASIVVFVSSVLPTAQVDTQTCNSGPGQTLTNGNTYYYKIFMKDAGNFYSSNPAAEGGSQMNPQVAAFPSATVPAATNWVMAFGNGASTITPPGINPTLFALTSSTANPWLTMISPNTGHMRYPPIKIQGTIDGRNRTPIIEFSDSSTGLDMAYVASADGFIYGFNAFNGAYHFARNPTGEANPSANNNFIAGAAVVVNSFGMAGYTLGHDLVVTCTASGATSTGNSIVAVHGGTGVPIWTTTGGVGGVPTMDDCFSTPLVDYVNGAIFVTTNRNAGTPNLWKLNPNTGAVLASVNLAGADNDITSSPSLTPFSEVLFVTDNSGNLRAIRPDTLGILATVAVGAGSITDFPIVRNIASPWQVIFRAATGPSVRSVTFACTTFSGGVCTAGAFTTAPLGSAGVWTITPLAAASQPITSFGLPGGDKVYVGSSTGPGIRQYDIATGVFEIVRNVPTTVGAASLDTVLNRIIVGSSNGLVYSYSIPF